MYPKVDPTGVDDDVCIVQSASMAMKSIRVDSKTHAQLVELSQVAGASLIETVRDATEDLRRQRLGRRVAAELAEIRNDPDAWETYIAEERATSVSDGIV